MPCDFQREHVLVLAAGAVEHFDRIDHFENCKLGGAIRISRIDWLGVGIDEREARVELVPEGMIRGQNSALKIHDAPKFGEFGDSASVTPDTEHHYMPQTRAEVPPAP